VLDIGFGELIVIAVVALVVIGPERLPRVARTAGHLLGRFQRYVADVKADINREIEMSEFKNIKSSVEEAARSIESTVKTEMEQAGKELRNVEDELKHTGEELEKAGDEIKAAAGLPSPHMGMGASAWSGQATSTEPEPAGAVPGALASAAAPASVAAPELHPVDEAADTEPLVPSPQLELGLDSGMQPAASSPPHRPV
jgi:sec-independent protein translocase protein TatB